MKSTRLDKQIVTVLDFASRILVACGLMVWGVCNFWNNVLRFREPVEEEQAWGVAAIFVILTAVVPFLVGLAWVLLLTGPKILDSAYSNKKTAE